MQAIFLIDLAVSCSMKFPRQLLRIRPSLFSPRILESMEIYPPRGRFSVLSTMKVMLLGLVYL